MADHVELSCKRCKAVFKISAALYKSSVEKKYPRKFCSRSCAIAGHQKLSGKNVLLKHRESMKRMSDAVLRMRPVVSMGQMSIEKQEEMKRLYERPYENTISAI